MSNDLDYTCYYLVSVSFTNGSVQGYKSQEAPYYNDLQDCYCLVTLDEVTVRLPLKNITSLTWQLKDC